MRIPPDTIQLVQQTANIVEVVNDFVSLKKRGANYTACCPFHNEKTPSFNVNPARGIYKCFGCGKAGDSVRFIMDIEGLGFPEAIKYLAKKYNIEIKETAPTNEELLAQNERESLLIVLGFAQKFYQEQLLNSDEGQAIGLSYFRERGFNQKTIQTFGLGYSPDRWDALTQAALKQGYSLEILEKAGLTIRKEDGKTFDRFRARVTFPIHNLAGKVIAFGARILNKDKNQPKYLNSPETEVYHKSNVLYGIYQARQAIRQEDVCYLVEGYTDVVSLHQAGIHNVVASSGTSLTIEQIRLIHRFTPNVTVLYDGDAAGIKASLRGTDMILEEGLDVKVVVFPDGEDPDSYVHNVGGLAFINYINTAAKDFITFKAELSLNEAGTDPFKRANVIREMVESIAKIPDSIKRSIFFQKTAALMGIDEGVLIAEANKLYLQQAKQKGQNRPAINPTPATNSNLNTALGLDELPSFEEGEEFNGNGYEQATTAPIEVTKVARTSISYHEEECARLLIKHGVKEIEKGITVIDYILHELRDLNFETPLYHRILEHCRVAYQQEILLDAQDYLAHDDNEIRQQAIDFLSDRYQLSHNWKQMHQIHIVTEEENLHESAFTNILRLKKGYNDMQMATVKKQIATATDAQALDQLLVTFQKMKQIDKHLANELGTVVKR